MFQPLRQYLPFASQLTLFALAVSWHPLVHSADRAFVGRLAILVDNPEAPAKVQLSDEQLQRIRQIVGEREGRSAIDFASSIRNLPAAERDAKMAEYAKESEKIGLAILSEDQKTQLEKLRLAAEGLPALADVEVAKQVGLNEDQAKKVLDLIQSRNEEAIELSGDKLRLHQLETNRLLLQSLTDEQRVKWEQMSGLEGTPASESVSSEEPKASSAETKTTQEKSPPSAPKSTPETSAGKSRTTSPTASDSEKKPKGEQPISFKFKYAPWKDVLEYFAERADLSLVMDAPPPGTFNYSDNREYTAREAIDVINSVLQTKGYALWRRGRMLLLVNLEDKIPPDLVTQVSADELDNYGEYELLGTLLDVANGTAEEAEADVKRLLGPQGSVVPFIKSRRLYVVETAGKLKTIRNLLDPSSRLGGKSERVAKVALTKTRPEAALTVLKSLLGLNEQNAAPDGSIRVAVDTLRRRIVATGRADRVGQLEEILQTLEKAETSAETPLQFEVYAITEADTDLALRVLQTLTLSSPDVIIDKDPKSGNLIVLAREADHELIREKLGQMQRADRQTDVIKLRRIDPALALAAINKLFGGSADKPAPNAPVVDANPTERQLLIRANGKQVQQIRELLEKLGEVPEDQIDPIELERSKLRMLPLTGRAAQSTIEQVQMLWPTIRKNKIRVVTPSKSSGLGLPSKRSSDLKREAEEADKEGEPKASNDDEKSPESDSKSRDKQGNAREDANPKGRPAKSFRDDSAIRIRPGSQRNAWRFVAQDTPEGKDGPTESASSAKSQPPAKTEEKDADQPDVVITYGPKGLIIASDDVEALDEFERLFRMVNERGGATGREFTVYYLRYARVEVAMEILREALSEGRSDSQSSSGGLMGDIASSMLGNLGGGILGSLMNMSGGSGGGSSGAPTMVPDGRLNAMIVYGRPSDLEVMEQLLRVIDQESSPEDVRLSPKPRFIPIENVGANEVAQVLRQVYASRLSADPSQARQPTPEEFVRLLRGGQGGSRSRDSKAEEAKMTLGVDNKSNSLIVSAPDVLFEEVKALAKQLDIAGSQTDDQIEIVRLKRGNASSVQRSLAALLKPPATTTAAAPASSPAPAGPDVRQQMEMFNQLRGQMGPGGAFGPRPGGAGGGQFPPGGARRPGR